MHRKLNVVAHAPEAHSPKICNMHSTLHMYTAISHGQWLGLDRLCSQNHEKLLFSKPKSCYFNISIFHTNIIKYHRSLFFLDNWNLRKFNILIWSVYLGHMYIIKGLHSCRTKLNILNALASYRCFLFKISTTSHVVHMLIFVILIRHINTKLLKVAKIGKSSKVAQKLPSTICLGLAVAAMVATRKQN